MKQLGQSRPSDTNAASIYTPGSNITAEVNFIVVCNTTGGGESFRIFHDDDGTTYDQTTALYYDVAISANTTTTLILNAGMGVSASGNIAVRSSTGNALTFTVYGKESPK